MSKLSKRAKEIITAEKDAKLYYDKEFGFNNTYLGLSELKEMLIQNHNEMLDKINSSLNLKYSSYSIQSGYIDLIGTFDILVIKDRLNFADLISSYYLDIFISIVQEISLSSRFLIKEYSKFGLEFTEKEIDQIKKGTFKFWEQD